MDYYTYYNPPPSPESDLGDESMTRQEFRAECDINTIVARAGAGLVSLSVPAAPLFVDVSEVPTDYQSCLDNLISADAQFASLPSKVRERFDNNPALLFAFLADASNRDEAVRLGLLADVQPAVPAGELKQEKPSTSDPAS